MGSKASDHGLLAGRGDSLIEELHDAMGSRTASDHKLLAGWRESLTDDLHNAVGSTPQPVTMGCLQGGEKALLMIYSMQWGEHHSQ
jgi:hypothetical protein